MNNQSSHTIRMHRMGNTGNWEFYIDDIFIGRAFDELMGKFIFHSIIKDEDGLSFESFQDLDSYIEEHYLSST